MKRRILSGAAVSGLVLSMGLAATPVLAGPPTEIEVSPIYQDPPSACNVTERAYWTVSLWGGTSGNFTVTVYYGDGGHTSGPHPGSYDTHHDFACYNGVVGQTWSASRSGGGTAYAHPTGVNTE